MQYRACCTRQVLHLWQEVLHIWHISRLQINKNACKMQSLYVAWEVFFSQLSVMNYILTIWGFSRAGTAGSHKEMSSFLADQQRPRIWAQMRGEGVSANQYSCAHGVQIHFGDLTPYLTHEAKELYRLVIKPLTWNTKYPEEEKHSW